MAAKTDRTPVVKKTSKKASSKKKATPRKKVASRKKTATKKKSPMEVTQVKSTPGWVPGVIHEVHSYFSEIGIVPDGESPFDTITREMVSGRYDVLSHVYVSIVTDDEPDKTMSLARAIEESKADTGRGNRFYQGLIGLLPEAGFTRTAFKSIGNLQVTSVGDVVTVDVLFNTVDQYQSVLAAAGMTDINITPVTGSTMRLVVSGTEEALADVGIAVNIG